MRPKVMNGFAVTRESDVETRKEILETRRQPAVKLAPGSLATDMSDQQGGSIGTAGYRIGHK
jgi:hypothetical protein